MRGPRLYTGLSVTVGVEQSWHVQELWLGTGWDTHTWVCSQAVLGGRHYSAPFSITSALAGETKIRPGRFVSQVHLPSFSSLFSIRWQQTSKSSGLSSSLQPAGAKADALREEMEEAANRVEICRVSPHLFAPLYQDRQRSPTGGPFCSLEF